ncbi:hypothetical protein FKM82_022123 [Ascaphus truei]
MLPGNRGIACKQRPVQVLHFSENINGRNTHSIYIHINIHTHHQIILTNSASSIMLCLCNVSDCIEGADLAVSVHELSCVVALYSDL